MLDAVEEAAAKRWTVQEELLASAVELLSALYVLTLRINTDKSERSSIPDPIRWPRPTDPPKKKRSWLDLARAMTGRG